MPPRTVKPTPQLRLGLRSDFRKLGLDVRVVNALAAQGIVALEDLTHITARELASFRGIGPSTHKLLQDYLKKERPEPAIPLVLPAEFLRAIRRLVPHP